MTKKHFEALAEALRNEKPALDAPLAVKEQWVKTVFAVAFVCRNHNNNFRLERFYTAAGVEGGKAC